MERQSQSLGSSLRGNKFEGFYSLHAFQDLVECITTYSIFKVVDFVVVLPYFVTLLNIFCTSDQNAIILQGN